ncbi:predicted protein, partial [Nematostella vectensis]
VFQGSWECKVRRNMLGKQQQFIDHIVRLMKEVSQFSGNRSRKIHRLRELLDTPELTRFGPLPLPLDPDVRIMEVTCVFLSEKAWLFKSHLMPAKLTFRDINEQEYVVIFKNGDDLRQDQLILQMIRLMDKVRIFGPYSACGKIRSTFSDFAPPPPQEKILGTGLLSVSGYCVITYLLGVGDRHLDNLLLTKSGNLFHIDFGYILGRDPKPLPPPMKLSKEMVEGMGGANGECYQAFRKQCYTAFLHLRRHANLILNLFGLMVDASVPDIALEPDKTVKKVQDKFRLDLSDEEAVQYLQSLIDESVSAMFAVVVEQIHKFAQ